MLRTRHNALPGFGPTMGFTIFYLSVVVLIPLAALFLKAAQLTWADFWRLATDARALAAYRLTFGASLAAAILNAIFGSILAWVLVRYRFPGRRFVDALVDFPFALPTAVAGLTLASLYSPNGWLGQFLIRQHPDGTQSGVQIPFTGLGVIVALTFVGLPFVVRTLQPVMEGMEHEVEEVAATLGSSRFRTFCTVIVPTLLPTVITGFALAFARAIGEYGSVIFIAGNKPFSTEIAPLLVVIRLEEYNYNGAVALAVVLMMMSFLLLVIINLLERWASHYHD